MHRATLLRDARKASPHVVSVAAARAPAGSSSTVLRGNAGHHRSGAAGALGSTLSPGRGVTIVTPARVAAARARSIGSVHPCAASAIAPQCTGRKTRPRTS
jgi:hypothetical protein